MHSSIFKTPLAGDLPCHTASSRKPLILFKITSNMLRPQHSLSLVSRSPSLAIWACLAVPSFSMLGTTCKAAYLGINVVSIVKNTYQLYFASNRFCLVSGFSPSLQNGLGRMFWKGAACSKSQTSSCDRDCSISRQNKTALPNSLKLWKS